MLHGSLRPRPVYGVTNVVFARVRLSGWSLLRIFFDSFGEKVVPVLVKHNLGVLGMKPLAEGAIPKSKSATAVECLQYAMSLPTSVVITGDSMQVLQQAIGAARNFKPLGREQMAALLAKTATPAENGRPWPPDPE